MIEEKENNSLEILKITKEDRMKIKEKLLYDNETYNKESFKLDDKVNKK